MKYEEFIKTSEQFKNLIDPASMSLLYFTIQLLSDNPDNPLKVVEKTFSE